MRGWIGCIFSIKPCMAGLRYPANQNSSLVDPSLVKRWIKAAFVKLPIALGKTQFFWVTWVGPGVYAYIDICIYIYYYYIIRCMFQSTGFSGDIFMDTPKYPISSHQPKCSSHMGHRNNIWNGGASPAMAVTTIWGVACLKNYNTKLCNLKITMCFMETQTIKRNITSKSQNPQIEVGYVFL